MHRVFAALALLGALAAVEKYYQHPTYGNGLRALLAAARAGEAL